MTCQRDFAKKFHFFENRAKTAEFSQITAQELTNHERFGPFPGLAFKKRF
jgi:hypothetical protein